MQWLHNHSYSYPRPEKTLGTELSGQLQCSTALAPGQLGCCYAGVASPS